MSKAVRTALLLVAAGMFIILVVWILFLPMLQASPTGSEVGLINTFGPYPMTFSAGDPAEYSTAALEELTPSHIEIDGEEPTPTSTLALEAAPPTARPLTNTFCRTGPRVCERALALLTPDQIYPVEAKLYDGSWLKLVLIPTELTCWVRTDLLDVSGDLDLVLELDPGLLPCATPSPTNAPPGCWVIDAQHPNGYCRPGTCTPNDFPGTSCTLP